MVKNRCPGRFSVHATGVLSAFTHQIFPAMRTWYLIPPVFLRKNNYTVRPAVMDIRGFPGCICSIKMLIKAVIFPECEKGLFNTAGGHSYICRSHFYEQKRKSTGGNERWY